MVTHCAQLGGFRSLRSVGCLICLYHCCWAQGMWQDGVRDTRIIFRSVPCCRAASVLPPWNSHCKIELIFGVMFEFNVVWCIHSCRETVLTIQSDNGKQGYKVGGKKYCRPKVVLSRQPWRAIWQRLDSETRRILSSQREVSTRALMCMIPLQS